MEFNAAFGPDDARMIEGCGHMVMREKHDEVNRIMSDFLERSGVPADMTGRKGRTRMMPRASASEKKC